MKDNNTGKNSDFYALGKKMFDRLNPHIAHNPKVVGPEKEPVAWMSHNKENFVSADDVGNSVPNWTDYYPTPLYTTPLPCPTCEALARTVMLDQTSHDRHKREWVGLTDDELLKTYGWEFVSYGQSDRPSLGPSILDEAKQEIIDGLRKVEALLKEKNYD